MKTYRSFLIRCWCIRAEPPEPEAGIGDVFEVTHIQTGAHRRVHSLSEVERFIAAIQRESRPAQPDPDPEEGS